MATSTRTSRRNAAALTRASYGAAANRSDQIDYVQHVGDYSTSILSSRLLRRGKVYEYKNGDYGDGTKLGRVPQPNRECSSLQDYRDRCAARPLTLLTPQLRQSVARAPHAADPAGYRSDPQLQALHQKVAWQVVWVRCWLDAGQLTSQDDHEVADNSMRPISTPH